MGRIATKNSTGYYRSIDIREFKRKGWLQAPGWRTLTWRLNGEVTATIGIWALPDQIRVRYTCRPWSGEPKQYEYPVFFDFTKCNYGGERRWFICPARGCSRRVAVLYMSSIFACRHCLDLAYESQRESPWQRAFSKARRIREKVGCTDPMEDDFPDKPKWMHWRTYSVFMREYNRALGCSWLPFLRLG
jgi:hypothetical protein